ncbi:MAG: DivIVA domain-containing protein [Oscillospiraceae bacterium]|nr:DivIVA domain-containing protein [Oscillospiraceae bacterium]
MLTAKDINNKRFEQARPGYCPSEVDDFLRELANEVGKFQKDKEELEKKIEVLVDSVREYKKDEEALKDALVGAQKQGRAVITEAQQKADGIIANATAKAGEILGGVKIQHGKEKQNLAKMQKEVSDFKRELLSMYKLHLEQITAMPDYDDEDEEFEAVSEEAAENPVSAVTPEEQPPEADELEKLSSAAGKERADRAREELFTNERSPFDELKNPSRAASRFGDLKFGNNS